MTVYDHLFIYAGIKGVPFREIPGIVKNALVELELTEKAHSLAKTLSGGQKRRLCIGNAFIGGSKIVFLDEPTSGLDPHTRRAIWSMFILLTCL